MRRREGRPAIPGAPVPVSVAAGPPSRIPPRPHPLSPLPPPPPPGPPIQLLAPPPPPPPGLRPRPIPLDRRPRPLGPLPLPPIPPHMPPRPVLVTPLRRTTGPGRPPISPLLSGQRRGPGRQRDSSSHSRTPSPGSCLLACNFTV